MDQIKIGQFIAAIRHENRMTQKQLADALSVSDKTVSKWECGKGLPEVSLMLPLCTILQITVNELLTGERIEETEYQKKAEENMMNLMEENAENKKRMILSAICGSITIVAVCALVVIAAYIDMPAAARIALLFLAVTTAIVGTGAAAVIERQAGYFVCAHCQATFQPGMHGFIKGYHTFTKRRLTCPECGKTSMCRHRIIR